MPESNNKIILEKKEGKYESSFKKGLDSVLERFTQEYFRIINLERPCEILGISNSTSPEEARKAYRRLAQVFHPDKVDPYWKETADRAMAKLAEAYRKISKGTR